MRKRGSRRRTIRHPDIYQLVYDADEETMLLCGTAESPAPVDASNNGPKRALEASERMDFQTKPVMRSSPQPPNSTFGRAVRFWVKTLFIISGIFFGLLALSVITFEDSGSAYLGPRQ